MGLTLFVYGTLKRGYCRDHFLVGQRFLGAARTVPSYRMFDCGEYPGLTEVDHGLSIEGELWEIDEACLAALDREECLDVGLFRRGTVLLRGDHAGRAEVQCYFYDGDTSRLPEVGTCWK